MDIHDEFDFDQDGNPEPVLTSSFREEPDCFACNDDGCRHCGRHEPECPCVICTTPVIEPNPTSTTDEEAPF
ncbi:MAG TPA: hypothetical protein VNO31_09425 [Umezawaea sp.]|nr:hypothetical protein [Umezawaea sp.]